MTKLISRADATGVPSCCAYHLPVMRHFERRVAEYLSRRDALRLFAGGLAVPVLGASIAKAQDSGRIRLTNVRIFDGTASTLRDGLSVLIAAGKIEALPPQGETVAEATVIDCGGRVLMPGMIDAHSHIMLAAVNQLVALTADVPYVHLVAAKEAEQTLMRGFTSIRDVGGPAFALKQAIDEGIVAGPRIYPSGAMISQTSGHGDFRMRGEIPRGSLSCLSATETTGVGVIADGVPEVLRRTREQLLLGASQIKITVGGGVSSAYDPIDTTQYLPSEIEAAVAAAEDWGTYVCAHVYVPRGIKRAIEAGVKSIEHGQLADEESARLMADRGIWWSLQPFLMDEDANPKSLESQRQDQAKIAEGTERAYELAKTHKVNMAWGTDLLFSPGKTWRQNRQLTKTSRWLGNDEVLKMATSRNGELLALSGPRNPYPGKLGVIAAGGLADLLVVDGNPLENLAVIEEPEKNLKIIMKGGRVHKNTLAA